MGNWRLGLFPKARRLRYLLSSVCLFMGVAHSLKADPTTIERLEKGELVSRKVGSLVIQQIVKKPVSQVAEAFSQDVRKITRVFQNVAFARPYMTKDRRSLIYLKLRGLGDGLGVLMEVKEGSPDLFTDAIQIATSGESLGLRDTASEVDLRRDPQNLEVTEPTKQTGQIRRRVSLAGNLVLEGPLNRVLEMPNLRMTVNLGIGSYKVLRMDPKNPESDYLAEVLSEDTYIVSKVSFAHQVAKGELGDYRGFGERRLAMAEMIGSDVFNSLKFRLESK